MSDEILPDWPRQRITIMVGGRNLVIDGVVINPDRLSALEIEAAIKSDPVRYMAVEDTPATTLAKKL